MAPRTVKDALKALRPTFAASRTLATLPPEQRRVLQDFAADRQGKPSSLEALSRANDDLRDFHEKCVGDGASKLGAFVGVLRELLPLIGGPENVFAWWKLVVKPVVSATTFKKPALDDAREFLLGFMVVEDESEAASLQAKQADRICGELLELYLARARAVDEGDQFVAAENLQVLQQAEDVLVAYGRKRPKELFHRVDDLVPAAATRLPALTLLSSFLRHQVPHLYLVVHTPLVEHLLKCLMNDTSTAVLAVALTCLIMLLPHIPGSLPAHLPRLFLIYSRLLCWEKFSPLSTQAQRNLVTDERLANDEDDEEDHDDVGVDENWDKARPSEDAPEAATPEVFTYFTYLYGLYPLNLASYIRKPRKYLKNCHFPGADDFDLDQNVIRGRTEQFRQAHLLHPNFYNLTVEEELDDPKWPRMDPADVVGECHGLCVNPRPSLTSPGPPPSGKLPELPPPPPAPLPGSRNGGPASPSQLSHPSGHSWHDTHSTAVSTHNADGDSPVLRPGDDPLVGSRRPRSKASMPAVPASPDLDDFPLPGGLVTYEKQDAVPQTNVAFLQQKLTMLRNELNFERWHKAQYSQHIGQIHRKNIKDATLEAETLNLINANKTLKIQLDQVRRAREASIKDSTLTRKQANSLENNMSERFNRLKTEQETWHADADELRKLRTEMRQYREMLVATEARELNQAHELELAKRDVANLQHVHDQLADANEKLIDYEYRAFDLQHAQRDKELLQNEKSALLARLHRQDQDRDRLRRALTARIADLEAQLASPSSPASLDQTATISTRRSSAAPPDAFPHPASPPPPPSEASAAKLTQLKKSYARLLEKHTDLELELQTLQTAHDVLRARVGVGADASPSQPNAGGNFDDSAHDYDGAFGPASAPAHSVALPRPRAPLSLPPSGGEGWTGQERAQAPGGKHGHGNQASLAHSAPTAGRGGGAASLGSGSVSGSSSGGGGGGAEGRRLEAAFNVSRPLGSEEARSSVGEGSFKGRDGKGGKERVGVGSEARVYGRGGAQNVKLKQKDKDTAEREGKEAKKSRWRELVS